MIINNIYIFSDINFNTVIISINLRIIHSLYLATGFNLYFLTIFLNYALTASLIHLFSLKSVEYFYLIIYPVLMQLFNF